MKNIWCFCACMICMCTINQALAQQDVPVTSLNCVTEEDYQQGMLPLLQKSYNDLLIAGKLQHVTATDIAEEPGTYKSGLGDLQWPLRMAANYVAEPGVYDYFQIWNYADLENDDDGVRLDWMCNTGELSRNYDNHNGVDIVPYPFRWNMLANGYVDVIAAADGEVLFLDDGNFDLNCGDAGHIMGDFPGYGHYGNFVALLHEDGSVTLYGHMKNGSVADLEPGDEVVAGQYLGKVGSSGNSSDPHLHFEVRECLECPYFEPWFDPSGCNTDVDGSWWSSQRPYFEPQVLRVMTHYDYPDYYTCGSYEAGTVENIYERNHFLSGATVYIGVYLRDFLDGDALSITIYNSSNVVQESWSLIATEDHYYGYSFSATEIMTGDPNGTYRLSVVHDGKTYNHFFTIGCTSAYSLSASHTGYKGYIAGDYITSSASIAGLATNQVLYEAENYILLTPGFVSTANSTFQARIDDCSLPGVKEEMVIDPVSNVKVYPNPTMGIANIEVMEGNPGRYTTSVYNITGNLVFQSAMEISENTFQIPLDLTDLAKGVYVVQLQTPAGMVSENLVIQ